MARTPDGAIWYEDNRRDPAVIPTLMIHGAGGAHTHFPAAMRHMPEANAIALDLPGHGESVPPGRTTIQAYANDVIRFMDALNIPKAIIAGHSMGGAISLTLALDHPARVAGLILIATGAKLGVHPDILNGLFNEFLQVCKMIVEWEWHHSADQELRDVIGYKTLIGTPAEIVQGDYTACNAFDVRQRLSEIHVPTLVIGGTVDKMTPHKYSQYLVEHIPKATLITVEQGAHMMALEQPAYVTEAVRRWLAQARTAGTLK